MRSELATAHGRFGLGARPGDLDRDVDAHALLAAQVGRDTGDAAFAGLPTSADYLHEEAAAIAMARQPGPTSPAALRAGSPADATTDSPAATAPPR